MKKLTKSRKLIKIKEKYLKSLSILFKGIFNDFSKDIKDALSDNESSPKKLPLDKKNKEKNKPKKVGRKPKKQRELNSDELK